MPPPPDPPLPSPDPDALLQRVLDLIQALRRAGVGATQAEAIDAVRMLRHLDLLDRARLREALASTTVSSRSERRRFDQLFDLYLPARPGAAGPRDHEADAQAGDPPDPDAFVERLLERLMGGDAEAVRRLARSAVDEFGRVEGRDGGTSYFQYRVFRAVDLQDVLQRMLERRAGRAEELSPLQRRLWRDEFEARLQDFEEEVTAEVRRRAAAARGVDPVADRMIETPLEQIDFFRLSEDEQRRMRAELRPLARKLATRVAAKRRRGRDGRLDVRRTVRRSLATGGVPFEPAFRPRRRHKPELYVLCDLSGSVASFARFTLMLVHTLQDQFTKVRSFAFIDTLDEVTALFDEGDLRAAMTRLRDEADLVWLDGHSDYGHSLEVFHEDYADAVSARSTVLILGDARNNHRRGNAWVLEELQTRARRVFWLNPEPIQYWGTGDSIVTSYARFVSEMVEVRNLDQLTRFVERVA